MKDVGYVNLKELLARSDFQKMQDEIASATGIAMITVDYTGSPITLHSQCSEFCRIVRKDSRFARLCEKCDSRGGVEAARLKRPYIYLCHMGIVDFAIPIIINGLYLGAVMAGQVLAGDMSGAEEKLERIVTENSFPALSGALMRSYEKLPVLAYEKINSLSKIISYFCNSFIRESIEKFDYPEGGQEKKQEIKHSGERAVIAPAIEYIKNNYKNKISLNLLAELCRISPTYLSRLFKKETGYKYAVYVNMMRIGHAKRLLASTNKSVSDISQELGFEDTGYFTKVFKKLEGCTPSRFRAECPVFPYFDPLT